MNKFNLFGIHYTATNYEAASRMIVENACINKSYGVSALAVHGLITAYKDPVLRESVNRIDLVVPDGQPVRWVLNSFYALGLKDRVSGPKLTLDVLRKAHEMNLKVYLYGSTEKTCKLFAQFINHNFPNAEIVGIHIDRFREATIEEDHDDINKINVSRAQIVLVGRGCPRQEFWVANHLGKVNAVMMAVGAAFDFHAGTVKKAPSWMEDNGLEWLFRISQEPRRLWKRYLTTNSYFIFLFIKHKFFLKKSF